MLCHHLSNNFEKGFFRLPVFHQPQSSVVLQKVVLLYYSTAEMATLANPHRFEEHLDIIQVVVLYCRVHGVTVLLQRVMLLLLHAAIGVVDMSSSRKPAVAREKVNNSNIAIHDEQELNSSETRCD
jgi:hypothetical protein